SLLGFNGSAASSSVGNTTPRISSASYSSLASLSSSGDFEIGSPHFVVENAVLVRLYVLAALEVERQEHRCPLSARPTDEMVIVIFLEHGCIPLCHRRNVRVAPPGAELASLQSRAPCW